MPAQTRSVVEEHAGSSIARNTVSGLIARATFPGLQVPTYAACQPQLCPGGQLGWNVPMRIPLAGSLPGTLSLNSLIVLTFEAVEASGGCVLRSESGIDLCSALTRAATHAVTNA